MSSPLKSGCNYMCATHEDEEDIQTRIQTGHHVGVKRISELIVFDPKVAD